MTLVYRAIWQDDSGDLLTNVRNNFSSWVSDKYCDLSPALVGQEHLTIRVGNDTVESVVETGEDYTDDSSMMEVLRATLIETRNAGGSRWETRIRAWTSTHDNRLRSNQGWAWVDVSAVGDDIDVLTLSPAAPRIVRDLLAPSTSVHIDRIPIDADVLQYYGRAEGEALAELVSSPDRRLPIVVFTCTDVHRDQAIEGLNHSFDDIVAHATNRVAGIARVAIADVPAASALTSALGESHGIWGNAFRIYMKDVDPAVPNDAVRHRYILPNRFIRRRSLAGHIIAKALAPVSALQRPPQEYDLAKHVLDRSMAGDDLETRYERLLSESDTYAQEVIDLRKQIVTLTESIEGLRFDAEMASLDVNELRSLNDLQARHLRYLQDRLEKFDSSDLFAKSSLAYVSIPTEATTSSQAVEHARRHLSDYLTIPVGAVTEEDLEKFDTCRASHAIAANTWHGFRALHAYAKAMAIRGTQTESFWNWCKYSDDPWKWRATTTSLAMRESDTVSNHPEDRTFVIDSKIAATGKVFMDKHLKFDTNGEHAPRIYFFYDSHESRMHVGFYGPHTRLKNSTT